MVNKITSSKNLRNDIEKVLEPLGGIKSFVGVGERVLLKPNFNTADPFPASSDMAFVGAVIEVVETQKPKEIILAESPTYFGNAEKNFNGKNPQQLEEKFSNLKVMFLNNEPWVKTEIPKGKYLKNISLPKILNEVDKTVYLPCLKTHAWAQYTGALKLTVGFVRPIERLKLHTGHLQEKIAEINTLVNTDLVIMDGRKCFTKGGPEHGELAEPNVILASPHRVELDVEGVKLIQSFPENDLIDIEAQELPQLKYARALGIK